MNRNTAANSIAVVIPVYNYAHTVARAIQSVLVQMAPGVELVVVNDGSRDKSDTVIQSLVDQHPGKIRYIKQENRGLSGARNTGMRNSTGEFLCFLDADDELADGALEKAQQFLQEHPTVEVVFGNHVSVSPSGREKHQSVGSLSHDRVTNFRNYFRKRLRVCNGATLIRRRVLEARPYDESIRHSEDISQFAAWLATCDCAWLKADLAVIHTHPDSMRHDAAAAQREGVKPVETLFERGLLPAELNVYRRECLSLRCLSLFRTLYRTRMYGEALACYRRAVVYDYRTLFKWRYTRKALTALYRNMTGRTE